MDVACPICGHRAEQVANRFYGTGLAVHEFLVDCRTCGRALVEQKRTVEVVAAVARPVKSSLSRFLRKMF